jgi:hypothetical protein
MEGAGISHRAGNNNDNILYTLCGMAYKVCRDTVRSWRPGAGDQGYAGTELQEAVNKEN